MQPEHIWQEAEGSPAVSGLVEHAILHCMDFGVSGEDEHVVDMGFGPGFLDDLFEGIERRRECEATGHRSNPLPRVGERCACGEHLRVF